MVDHFLERRSDLRVECKLNAKINRQTSCEIFDLSTRGAMVGISVDTVPAGTFILSLEIPKSEGSYAAEKVEKLTIQAKISRKITVLQDYSYIGISFIEMPERDHNLLKQYVHQNAIRRIEGIGPYLARAEPSIDPASINDQVDTIDLERALVKHRVELAIFQEHLAGLVYGHLTTIEPETLTIELRDSSQRLIIGAAIHALCVHNYLNHYFQAIVLQVDGTHVQLSQAITIFSYDFRNAPRDLISADQRLSVDIPLPYPPGTIATYPVIDISAKGLAFKCQSQTAYFLVGTPINELRIRRNGEYEQTYSGQVRHVTPLTLPGEPTSLKVGIHFRINVDGSRLPVTTSMRNYAPDPPILSKFWTLIKAWATHVLPATQNRRDAAAVSTVETIRYSTPTKEHIAAILSTTSRESEKLYAPVVIIVPAHGKRKESTYGLALTLIENFKRRKKELVIIRYDNVRSMGESHKDPECRTPDTETLHWKLSQGVTDLEATLKYVYNNTRFYPTEVIIVSTSGGALPTRRLLAKGSAYRVDYWISLMGVPAVQEVLINTSGGIDYITNYILRIPMGIRQILGVSLDMDAYAADAIEHHMAFMSQAQNDFRRIEVPTTWICGEYDAWIDRANVQEVMDLSSSSQRKTVTLPIGHLPLNGDEAEQCFAEVTNQVWRYLFEEDIEAVAPEREELKRIRHLEWSRTARRGLYDKQAYWQKFLMGEQKGAGGFTVFEFFPEYVDFIKRELELLDLKPSHTFADMGTGIGSLPFLYLDRFGGTTAWKLRAYVLVDFIPEALNRVRQRLTTLAQQQKRQLPPTEYHTINLQFSPIKAVERFLRGEYFGYEALKGIVPGLSDQAVEVWKKMEDWRLHNILRGRPLTRDDISWMHENLPASEHEVTVEFNRLARLAGGTPEASDFIEPVDFHRTSRLHCLKKGRFDILKPNLDAVTHDRLPFEDHSFDRISCSLVLSYLENPAETLTELVRCLKPGGRIVISSMMPDADGSRMYIQALKLLEGNAPVTLPNGFTRESMIDAIRAQMNHISFLIQMAEEVQFRFFSREELKQLVERSGLSRVETFTSYGDPPQAYITVGYKV